uniref:Uncharacterized protein n=1 Tax=Neobodo designis TaxID=312471 RepID=A0A7S1QZK6_NEODS|mmetsp:Transcript_54752/g.168697  ORF Transcript_54752/g.168697 Transcript_54752/m.168697 type:complete len:701 (+) Transcript_54752:41-2143(+)|eukprot:CAMPEP_0174855260 /NCGR_PEP_ID=MMETSP1114-20130205/32846_1 /TAXON_ID=312471 /ORGANISM="Neobodo designis, Strain CCAP 1951/1" /LENGTH=700 /DNA_ID=CAMNT_0016089995 /DNA_START=40 /DNA_END=2142 /DNA_ORIENTATION=+
MQRAVVQRFASRALPAAMRRTLAPMSFAAASAPAYSVMPASTTAMAAMRFCASNGAATAVKPQAIAKIVESAAQPLYDAVSQATTADDVAERCLAIGAEVQKRKEGTEILSAEQQVMDAGLQLVAAESLTQIGLLEDALKDCESAIKVFEQVSGAQGYYTARCLCLRSRLRALMGDRDAALKDLNVIDVAGAAMDDAPTAADAWLLRTFIYNGRGSLHMGAEALQHFNEALGTANEAIKVAQLAVEEAKTKGAAPGAKAQSPEQSLFVALTMRATLLVDTAAALLRTRNFDEALKALDEAETAAKSLPSFSEGQDHPALGDIDYHRAVAFAGKGDNTAAAAKAAVAFRIVAATLPHAVDKLADIRELEAACLGNHGEGAIALQELDVLLKHIEKVEKDLADHVEPRVLALARRKALLCKLSLLDNRAEYEQVLKLFETGGLDKAIADGDVSPEGRLFAQTRKAQALALVGRTQDALDLLASIKDDIAKVIPERLPEVTLTQGLIAYGAGDEAGGMQLRKEAVEKIVEREGPEGATAESILPKEEEGEWYVSAASVASACALKHATDFARVDAILEQARPLMDRQDYCFLAAPLFYERGSHAEAAGKAREVLKAAEPTFLEKLDAADGPHTEGIDVPREMAEPVAIAALQVLRTEVAHKVATDRAVATVEKVIFKLRKDARHRTADRYARDLEALVKGTDV